MITWLVNHFEELRNRLHALFQLRRTIHGKCNYVFGKVQIVEPKKFKVGNGCRINHNCHINATNGVILADDVTLSMNCTIVSTGIDYLSWGRGARRHLTSGGTRW